MWKLLHASAAGTSHHSTGQPCQDYCDGRIIPVGGTSILLVASADGAGSAEHSDIGARLAVESFLLAAEGHLAGPSVLSPPDSGTIGVWVDAARTAINSESTARGIKPRQMACTLLAAIAAPDWTVFAQIGDGVIVCDSEEGYQYAFWPESGEYANTTRFLTDADFDKHLHIDFLGKPIGEIALLTDGLQMLALDFAGRSVHADFFRPIFELLNHAEDVAPLRESLIGFLNSKRVNERTDDDKTLLLATRRAPKSHALSDAVEAV